jgi:hypothetical protein
MAALDRLRRLFRSALTRVKGPATVVLFWVALNCLIIGALWALYSIFF